MKIQLPHGIEFETVQLHLLPEEMQHLNKWRQLGGYETVEDFLGELIECVTFGGLPTCTANNLGMALANEIILTKFHNDAHEYCMVKAETAENELESELANALLEKYGLRLVEEIKIKC